MTESPPSLRVFLAAYNMLPPGNNRRRLRDGFTRKKSLNTSQLPVLHQHGRARAHLNQRPYVRTFWEDLTEETCMLRTR